MKITSFCVFFLLALSVEASRSFYNRSARAALQRQATVDSELAALDDSANTGITTVSSRSNSEVDFSNEAVIRRLKIYIDGLDAGALFAELYGNRAAASLHIFEMILPELIEIISLSPGNKMFKGSDITPTNLVASIFIAFIHFGVDVTRASQFNHIALINIFVARFKAHHIPILAFFVLLQDFQSIKSFASAQTVNFYAVYNAILMLPDSGSRIRIVSLLYDTFGKKLLEDNKIPLRLFRDTPDVELCRLLCENGFNPLEHPSLYSKCRLAHNHHKWEYLSEIYGAKIISEFIDSGAAIKPQFSIKGSQPRLPFHVYPVKDSNRHRRNLYLAAYPNVLNLDVTDF